MAKVNWKRLSLTVGTLIVLAGVIYGYAAYKKYDSSQGDLNRSANNLDQTRQLAKDRGLMLEIDEIMTEQRMQGLESYDDFVDLDQILIDNPRLQLSLIHVDESHNLGRELDATPEALEALYRSASIDNVNFPVNWERGLLAKSMEKSSVNKLVNLAASSALVAFDNGDEIEAWRRLAAGVKVMGHLKDEPVYESVGAWSSSANRLLRTMFGIIKRDPTNALSVENTLALSDEIGDPQTMESVLHGEILRFVVTARDFEAFDYYEIGTLKMFSGVEKNPPPGRDRPAAFENAALEFWMSALDDIENIDNDIEKGIELDRLGKTWSENSRPSQYIGIAYSSTYEQLGKQISHVKQMRRLVNTVCMLLSDWHQTGEIPDAMEERDGLTTDPVSGKQFYYNKTENGFTLQALGMLVPEQVSSPTSDLTWVQGQGYGLSLSFAN